nr:uncharacterized protein LOC110564358 isoform X4 [Meriones unguiculatus]
MFPDGWKSVRMHVDMWPGKWCGSRRWYLEHAAVPWWLPFRHSGRFGCCLKICIQDSFKAASPRWSSLTDFFRQRSSGEGVLKPSFHFCAVLQFLPQATEVPPIPLQSPVSQTSLRMFLAFPFYIHNSAASLSSDCRRDQHQPGSSSATSWDLP